MMTVLKELDIQDKEGRVVISPDLKVRHKKSQYEYTVDSVTQDDSGKQIVLLRMPEDPRIEKDAQEKEPELMRDLSSSNVLYELDPTVMIYEPEESEESPDDLLAVPSDEFEREYEVK